MLMLMANLYCESNNGPIYSISYESDDRQRLFKKCRAYIYYQYNCTTYSGPSLVRRYESDNRQFLVNCIYIFFDCEILRCKHGTEEFVSSNNLNLTSR